MKLAIIGGGSWGSALAVAAANNQHCVQLFMRDVDRIQEVKKTRHNHLYLPSVHFPSQVEACWLPNEWGDELFLDADLIVIATPMSALRACFIRLANLKKPVVWVCKGFEQAQKQHAHGLLGHEILEQVAPHLAAGILSGPSFALEVAQSKLTAMVVASLYPPVCLAVRQAFHGSVLRIYSNEDVIGVEVGGAMKNILAIATGFCDQLSLGSNARAALLTRGLAEVTRVGVALGAKPETFMGLSGLGDLVLTATGDLSRNRRVGQELAKGLSLDEITTQLGHVAEGVYTAQTALERSLCLGVETPIIQTVVDLLQGKINPDEVIKQLMGRDAKTE